MSGNARPEIVLSLRIDKGEIMMEKQKTAVIYRLEEVLRTIPEEEFLKERCPAVIITDTQYARKWIHEAELSFDGTINLGGIEFCKAEAQQECLVCTFCIPKPENITTEEYHMLYLVNQNYILIIDDDGTALDVIRRIKQKRNNQGSSRERFTYNFMVQLLDRGPIILGGYEKKIMKIEEHVIAEEIDDFLDENITIRRELLILREYYDELRDMGKELEENENHFFDVDYLRNFGIIADRADRLMNRAKHLLDYINTVHDSYKEQVADQQNKNMEFLTIISTIFFPLTLVTGWYGMNFQNMPELAHGYPGVILLSIVIIIIIIYIFKKKKIL